MSIDTALLGKVREDLQSKEQLLSEAKSRLARLQHSQAILEAKSDVRTYASQVRDALNELIDVAGGKPDKHEASPIVQLEQASKQEEPAPRPKIDELPGLDAEEVVKLADKGVDYIDQLTREFLDSKALPPKLAVKVAAASRKFHAAHEPIDPAKMEAGAKELVKALKCSEAQIEKLQRAGITCLADIAAMNRVQFELMAGLHASTAIQWHAIAREACK